MSITQSTSQNRSLTKKVVTGGGMITTPAVMTHMRRKMLSADSPALQNQVASRRAVIGGGMITTPAVVAHNRSKKASTPG
ncbi:hypothetical protein JNX00_19590 [Hydrogenophaga sp. YM1]|uniref:hypothetical protein n=1 Tax=Hydrogenophaga sp. YM1 TaxID=2806262 RepID=UPI00195D5F9F|nr:hypothetical protein [Hydrogenophaga sp. YM1]QRR33814.1 hypothetical protein JNX00_19590 [Hydrogenophaga sp. YM1]